MQKLSIKQSAKGICRFDRLRTAHGKRQASDMSIGKLIVFDYIMFMVKAGLTSCEDLATVLSNDLVYSACQHM